MTALLDAAFEPVAGTVTASVVQVRSATGAGAGTAWADGFVITNDHVARADDVTVVESDGTSHEAKVVARNSDRDLALVQVEGLQARPIPRRRRALRAGEVVLVVGHPLGQRNAVNAGVVASAASPTSNLPFVRADVRLAPGNSGGPLVDAGGSLVGIAAMVAGGMALAIPVAAVEAFVAASDARADRSGRPSEDWI